MQRMPEPEISVVVPAYNEAFRLGRTLDRIVDFLDSRGDRFEILVVDDGSTDETAGVAAERREWGVRTLQLVSNRGKGAALRHGVVASRGARVLLTDADLSTPIEELDSLESALEEADIAMGSREVEGARVVHHQPRYRELLGRMFNLAIRFLGVRGFLDTQCGFKLLRGEVARDLFPRLEIEGFAYDVEMVLRARELGYEVVEVGVEWHDSGASRVRPFRDGFRMLWDVIRLRIRRRG